MLDNNVRSKQIREKQVRKIRSTTRLVLRSILNACNDIPVDHCCVGISTMKMIRRACKSFFIHKQKEVFTSLTEVILMNQS